ncbi:hypothetical protein AVEN_137978-1 [Araneus ventricosus]|uniref:Uncharacterized protein n=1 Tax=Araneus ventricosus TaxID=182803 RepID=A0A4Y2G5I1_ARAVE|nr:hypothetical protein AVEN_137978-1 [Araneus ventricosus]
MTREVMPLFTSLLDEMVMQRGIALSTQEFLKGHFVVHTKKCGFNLTACDQVIEKTFTRESKSKGGLTVHTKRCSHRWVLYQHERSSISNQCEIMAGKTFFQEKRTG